MGSTEMEFPGRSSGDQPRFPPLWRDGYFLELHNYLMMV